MTFDDVRKIALALPGVEDSTSYGTPALKVKGKFMARLRDDGDVVFKVGFDNAEMLMETNPQTFSRAQLADIVKMAWIQNAPKRLTRTYNFEPSNKEK